MAENTKVEPQVLEHVPIGCSARVLGFDGLPTGQIAHLLAYGLAPGRRVLVLQQSPVTVVQIEHTQIALEAEMAGNVRVEDICTAAAHQDPCQHHRGRRKRGWRHLRRRRKHRT